MQVVTIRPGQDGQLGSVVPKPSWSQKVFYAQELHRVLLGISKSSEVAEVDLAEWWHNVRKT